MKVVDISDEAVTFKTEAGELRFLRDAWFGIVGLGEYICKTDGDCPGVEKCERHTRAGAMAIRLPYRSEWPELAHSKRPIVEKE